MVKRLTTEEFIKRSNIIHSNKYNYSKTNYINARTKVCIICPEHGEFYVLPNSHLQGYGCKKCADALKSSSTEEFIKKAKEKHGDAYDYDKVNYVNARTKVIITCKKCGNSFLQKPNSHLNGCGCPYCNGTKHLSTEEFIEKSKAIHGNKYDYSKTKYVSENSKIKIICPKHGEFYQRPYDHMVGCGCDKCGGTKKLTTEEFIKKAKEVHGNKYDYRNVKYKSYKDNVAILCPKHGEFYQLPSEHLRGHGCPLCNESTLEREIKDKLQELSIEYVYQKKFDWLKPQSLDFYLPKYNIAIECQGEQHFKSVDHFGGVEGFVKRLKLDGLKQKKCLENGVRLLYYTNPKYKLFKFLYNSKNTILDINDLLNFIKL